MIFLLVIQLKFHPMACQRWQWPREESMRPERMKRGNIMKASLFVVEDTIYI